ncbi:MAG: DegT/DnrJ/EryC1/StrS family aminotransferase, partial [Patescibacteria group bacterium]
MDTKLASFITDHFRKSFPSKQFIPGESVVPVSGKVFDQEELMYGVQAVLDGWWTEGAFAEKFEKAFSTVVGARYVSLVNSGSSANLIAFSALTSTVFGEKALKPGDEVITS